MQKISVDEQMEIIRRTAVQIVPEEELREKLEKSAAAGKPLRIKYGADPSAPDIHLGHTIPLRKLRQFQDLGHLVVFIIGDFTALVGDPSGKSRTRLRLSPEQVEENARTYQEQVFKILSRVKTEVVYNSSWLSKMKFAEIIELASKYTVARMLERDDFSERYRKGQPISVLEFLYPLMQGYDSVAVRSDVEVGGTDQTFNLLVAREIQKEYGQHPQAILTLPLLEGTDGVQKMSKSLGNYVGIFEPAEEIYGKIMSISDELMWRYFSLLSELPPEEISAARKESASGNVNPMVWKKKLAFELTRRFTSSSRAEAAAERFSRVHQEKKYPGRMDEVELNRTDIPEGKLDIIFLLRESGLAKSNSEARRKLGEGAVTLNGEKIFEHTERVEVKDNDVIKLGKRNFRRIKIK